MRGIFNNVSPTFVKLVKIRIQGDFTEISELFDEHIP